MIHMECQELLSTKKKKKLKPSSTAVMIDVIPTSNFQLIRLLDSDININSDVIPTSNFQLIRLLDSDININSNALAYVTQCLIG